VALLIVHWLRLDQTVSNSLAIFSWTPFLLAYALGTEAGMVAGLAGVVMLAIALQAGSRGLNPFFEMITFGPWLAGRIILSRRHLIDQIEAPNLELGIADDQPPPPLMAS